MSLRFLSRMGSTWICLALSATVTWSFGVQEILRHQLGGFDGLDELSSVATSADGRHVYAGGLDGLMAMERNGTTGRVTPLQTLRAEFGYEAYSLRSLALSPDGRHLYGAGSLNDSLVIFERDVATGRLTWVETMDDQGADFDLDGVADVLVDPTGRHVYVVAQQAQEVLGFSRDTTSGRLELISRVDFTSFAGLRFPTDANLAPGGEHLYLLANGSVVILQRDTATGALEMLPFLPASQLAPLSRGDSLEIDASGKMVYVFGSLPSGIGRGILRLQRDVVSGALTPMEMLTDVDGDWGLGTTGHLLLAADGKNLYATAGFDAAGLVTFARAADGSLTHLQTLDDGEDGISGLDGPWEPALSPDGRHLYVPAEDDEAMAIFERSGTGALSPVDVVSDGQASILDGLDDPYYVLTSPDGQDVYVLGWNNEALARYRRPADGSLSQVQVLPLRTFVGPEVGAIRQLNASPDGRFLLARSDAGSLLLLARQADGSLEFLSAQSPGIQIRRAVFSPDNRFLYTSDGEDDLAVFEIDDASGQLSLRHQIFRAGEPFETLAIDPSGRFLYGGGSQPVIPARAEIFLFELDATTGVPTFVDAMDVAAGVGRRFWELAISDDGRFAAATGSTSTADGEPGLVIFERDLANGRLNETQRFVDGIAGVDSFRRPRDLSLSDNGRYFALNTDGAMNILERHSDSGAVEISDQKLVGGAGQPIELNGRGALAWAPQGEQLYMTSTSLDSLVVWSKTASQCVADATTLCLGEGGRFRVEVTWRDFAGGTGVGTKVTESTDSALFWFFDAANWEMLVKVIDACSFNGHYWVFAAATTNVEYTLTVTDTDTGVAAVYQNPLAQSSEAITDSEALATCP